VPLSLIHNQQLDLRLLQRSHRELAQIVTTIIENFDSGAIDNPQLAGLILEKTCRRIVANEKNASAVLIQHLELFGSMGCLSVKLVTDLIDRIGNMPIS
jgi:hypothetical protein